MKLPDKIYRKIKKLSLDIASLSAHKFEDRNWWGDDTQLGDLPFEIQKTLSKYTDWLLKQK